MYERKNGRALLIPMCPSPREPHTEQRLGQKCRHHIVAGARVKTDLQFPTINIFVVDEVFNIARIKH
jgi:hypothetical protein